LSEKIDNKRFLEYDHAVDLQLFLQGLGLHRYQVRVYLALLELGASNAGPIVKKTNLHREFVYNALDALELKGLVSYAVRRNRRLYQAASPSVLLQHERSRLAELENFLPQLIKLQQSERDRLEVRVCYGKEEFFRNLEAVAQSASRGDKIMRIVGGGRGDDFTELLSGRERAYDDLVKQLGVRKRMVGPADLSERFCRRFCSGGEHRLRLVAHELSSPTYTRITDEMTTIEIYAKEVMIIQILNRAVAGAFLDHFNVLWKRARAFSI